LKIVATANSTAHPSAKRSRSSAGESPSQTRKSAGIRRQYTFALACRIATDERTSA
jgi:hypothetical protein